MHFVGCMLLTHNKFLMKERKKWTKPWNQNLRLIEIETKMKPRPWWTYFLHMVIFNEYVKTPIKVLQKCNAKEPCDPKRSMT